MTQRRGYSWTSWDSVASALAVLPVAAITHGRAFTEFVVRSFRIEAIGAALAPLDVRHSLFSFFVFSCWMWWSGNRFKNSEHAADLAIAWYRLNAIVSRTCWFGSLLLLLFHISKGWYSRAGAP